MIVTAAVYDSDVQTTLVDVFRQFTDAVSQWQIFWDVVDEIDGSTCVLEPEKPTRAATYRRLALGSSRHAVVCRCTWSCAVYFVSYKILGEKPVML